MALKMKTTIGAKMMNSIADAFEAQKEFQHMVTGISLPSDDVKWFAYHTNAMVEELGEILKADKRWKTHRNSYYSEEEKLEEIADAFITLMNIALFSGFDYCKTAQAVLLKIKQNTDKYKASEEQKHDCSC